MSAPASLPELERAEFERAAAAAEQQVASFDQGRRSLADRARHVLHGAPTIIPAMVLLVSILIFGLIVGDRFVQPFNISLILQQVTVIGVIAAAQTLIILTAGIDLSVGQSMVLSSVVMGVFAVNLELPVVVAIPAGFLVGGLCGWINGALVTMLRLPPFIATLGTLSVFRALKLWYSHSETIRSTDIEITAPVLQFFGEGFSIGGARLTNGSICMILLFAVLWYALNWTPWGRHVHAVGDDPDAARLAGIRTNRVLLSVYVVAGLICALAAWVFIGRVGSVSPQAGEIENLDSITAAVIGGTSLFGGRGSIIGTLLGALIVGVFRNGLALADVDVLWQDFAVGVLIIVAVAIDQWLRRVSA